MTPDNKHAGVNKNVVLLDTASEGGATFIPTKAAQYLDLRALSCCVDHRVCTLENCADRISLDQMAQISEMSRFVG